MSIVNVSFNPTFITVGEHRPIKIAVTLPEDSPVFPSDELILEQQQFMPDGNIVFLPVRKSSHDPSHGQRIVTLRYDGNNTGQVTGGMVFTGYASFHEDVSGEIQLRVVAKVKHSKHAFVSTPFSIPVNHACGPTGTVLPVNIFEGGNNEQLETIEFDVPKKCKRSTAPSMSKLLNHACCSFLTRKGNGIIYQMDQSY